jgi:hypothetical protein
MCILDLFSLFCLSLKLFDLDHAKPNEVIISTIYIYIYIYCTFSQYCIHI